MTRGSAPEAKSEGHIFEGRSALQSNSDGDGLQPDLAALLLSPTHAVPVDHSQCLKQAPSLKPLSRSKRVISGCPSWARLSSQLLLQSFA